jgi:hypothetical protein
MLVMRRSSVGRALGPVAQNIAVPQVMQAEPDRSGCQIANAAITSLFVLTSASTNASAFAAAVDALVAVCGRGTKAAAPMCAIRPKSERSIIAGARCAQDLRIGAKCFREST